MQKNILSGSEFLLYNINDEPVAYSKNCAIKINQTLIDVTTKSSDSWSDFMVGIKDWSIEFEGLVSYGDGFNSDYFVSKYHSREPFFVRFGVLQDSFTHAFYGEVHIANIDQTANDGEAATFSGSLKGVGNLSFTNEGSPEQIGYLKTETDPVFRGSPAFNITENDKVQWHDANDKIVEQIQFVTSGSTTTLRMKFKDGNQYSTSFQNINSVDLSGYYTKAEADTKIATAQVAADTANTLLYNIGNDSKLTPNEKVSVLKEWLIIQDEKSKLNDQAILYSVETLNFDVAYIELDEYLEPLLISMESTSDILGYQLRDAFRGYYDQRVLLLKAIAEASKDYTDYEIDNIKIGHRNYHLNGAKPIVIYQTENQILQSGHYPTNTSFAISFLAKACGDQKLLQVGFQGGTSAEFITTDDWQRYDCLLTNNALKIFSAKLIETVEGEPEPDTSTFLLGFPYSFPISYKIKNTPTVNLGFPYQFPLDFNGTITGGIEIKNIMIVEGNKSIDFYPAPEDFYGSIDKAKEQATEASNEYNDLKIAASELFIKSWTDGKLDELEQINLNLSESALLAAKQYSDVTAFNARILANAYSDGRIDDIELKIINSSNANILAAKNFTLQQKLLAQEYAKSYADGVIDVTEAALIQNAQNNLASAKQYSDAQDLLTKTLAFAYSDFQITEEENKRIQAVEASLDAAKQYNDLQIAASELIIKSWADGRIDDIEAVLLENSNNNLLAAKQYSDLVALNMKTLAEVYADNLLTQEEENRLQQIQEALTASKQYTEAQRVLSEIITKSYADFVISEEEARAIADAQAKLNTAKAYADQKALDLKTEIIDIVDQSILDKANEIIANTTSLINVANTATLQAAEADAEAKATIAKNAAIASSNSYSQAQIALSEVTQQALLDGRISAEEQARINQAANNLQAAKDDATNKSNAASQYGIVAQNLHNALVGNLRSLAYEDVVEVSKLGSTVVEGGRIKTSLLDANYIKSDIINSTYINTLSLTASTITATTGKIGTWDISNYGLKDTTGSAYILSSIPYSGGGKTEVGIGLNAASSSNPDLPNFGSNYFASKFLSTSNRSNGINTAIYSEASGGSLGNFALHANGSVKIENGNLSLGSGSKIFTSGQEGITDDIGIKVQDARTGGQERVYSMHIRNGLIVGFTYVG